MWERTKAWFHHSATIALAWLMIAGGFVADSLSQLADILQSMGMSSYVPPKYIGAYTMALGVLTWLARMRGIWEAKHAADKTSGQ